MDLNDIYLKYKSKDFSLGLKGVNEIFNRNYWFCLFIYNKNEISKKEIINKFSKSKKLIFINEHNVTEEIGYSNNLYISRDNQKIFILEESLVKNVSFKTLSLIDFKARITKKSIVVLDDRYSTLNNLEINIEENILFNKLKEGKINFIFSELIDESYHVDLFISILINKIKENKKCCFISDENSTYIYSFYNKVIASACNIRYERLVRKKVTSKEKIKVENFKQKYGSNIVALKTKNYELNKKEYKYDYIFSLNIDPLHIDNKSIHYILKENTKTNEAVKENLKNKYSKSIKKANFIKGISEEEKLSFLNFITLLKSPFKDSFLLSEDVFFKNQEAQIITDIYGRKSDKTSVY